LGFVGFAVGNAMLVADLVIFPERDLGLMRTLPVLAGLLVLLYGLVWDTDDN
jgi:hypothetical protein